MNTHLTEEQIFDLAFDKLNIANPNPDKIIEIAEMLDLEYDEKESMYINPESKEFIRDNFFNKKDLIDFYEFIKKECDIVNTSGYAETHLKWFLEKRSLKK